MTRKAVFGAPSITGKYSKDLVLNEFGTANYPINVIATNLMPRDAVFPEIEGLFLRRFGSSTGTQKEFLIENYDQLQRLASSFESIAEIYLYVSAISIEESPVLGDIDTTVPDPVPVPSYIAFRRYQIDTPSLMWRVDHEFNTMMLSATYFDSDGNRLFPSKERPVSEGSFEVSLASATSGFMDIIFNTSGIKSGVITGAQASSL